ncbi:MAG: type II secretion system protein GspG [Planctomycetota bacterium]
MQQSANNGGSNGLGIAGFVVSLLGLITGGCLSPIGFILSLIAVFREPRGFAIAGIVLGLLGLFGGVFVMLLVGVVGLAAFLALISLGGLAGGLNAYQDAQAVWPGFAESVRQNAELPESIAALGAFSEDTLTDHWGTPYEYERTSPSTATLSSAGPDKLPGTDDDIAVLIELTPDGALRIRTPDSTVDFSVTP